MSKEPDQHFVTAKELAQYLKLTPTTVINLTIKGILPGFKIGKSWRFEMNKIQEALKINMRKDND